MDDDELQRCTPGSTRSRCLGLKGILPEILPTACWRPRSVITTFPDWSISTTTPQPTSMRQKLYNWDTLNARVLRKLDAALPRADVEAVCQCAPGAVESVLNTLQLKMARYRANQQRRKEAKATTQANNEAVAPPPAKAKASLQADVDQELLVEKEQEIHDLSETVDILEQKIAKLEQLVRLKDAKIQKKQRTRRRGGGDSARPVYSFLSLLSLPVVAVAATAWGRTALRSSSRRRGLLPPWGSSRGVPCLRPRRFSSRTRGGRKGLAGVS